MFSSVLTHIPACRSLKAVESQLLRASESLYLISSEFFFIPLDRRGIQPSATTVATCRFNIRSDNTRCLSSDCKACERSRTCAKLNASYTNRRNAILIAIYCQNQSANFRGVYRSRDITIYTRYLMKIFKKCVG